MNSYIDPNMLYNQAVLSTAQQKAVNQDDPEKLRQVCEEFEAIMIQAIYKGMRATITDGGLIEKDMNMEIIEGMLDQEVARQTAKQHVMGISEALFLQLVKEEYDETDQDQE